MPSPVRCFEIMTVMIVMFLIVEYQVKHCLKLGRFIRLLIFSISLFVASFGFNKIMTSVFKSLVDRISPTSFNFSFVCMIVIGIIGSFYTINGLRTEKKE